VTVRPPPFHLPPPSSSFSVFHFHVDSEVGSMRKVIMHDRSRLSPPITPKNLFFFFSFPFPFFLTPLCGALRVKGSGGPLLPSSSSPPFSTLFPFSPFFPPRPCGISREGSWSAEWPGTCLPSFPSYESSPSPLPLSPVRVRARKEKKMLYQGTLFLSFFFFSSSRLLSPLL